jgi:copper transport protein
VGRFPVLDGRAWGPAARHARRPRPRVAGRIAVVLVAALVAACGLLVGAGPADAHAVLESTEPTDGAQLDAAPEQIVLRFSESVQAADDGITVYAGSGDELDTGEPEHPDDQGAAMAVDLPDLDEGAYVVSYRVISSDSHPVSGAFTFTVGNVDPSEAQALQASLGGGTGGNDTLGIAYGVARFLAFAGIILLVGGGAFVLGVWPDGMDDSRVRRLVRTGWALAVVATAACIGLQGAYGAGLSLVDALDPSVIGDELGARAGRVWLIRLVLLAVVAVAATAYMRRRQAREPVSVAAAESSEPSTGGSTDVLVGGSGASGGPDDTPADAEGQPVAANVAVSEQVGGAGGNGLRPAGGGGWASLDEVRYVGLVLGLAILATVSFAGHAGAGRLVGLALVTDVIHLAGVSLWLGGLAVLVLVVLRRNTAGLDRSRLEGVVSRFSEIAFIAVLAIVASGVVQAWRQLDGWDALTGTAYGRLLLVKVGLVAAMVAAAGVSRAWLRGWFLAATDRAAKSGGTPGDASGANGQRSDLYLLRQSVGIEALIAIVVLSVTAALVQAAPEEASGSEDSGPFETEVHGSNVALDAAVAPTAVGPVDIDLQVAFHDGTPLEPEEITAELELPERDLGPLDVELEPLETGHYRSTGAELPFPGEWELEVTVRTSDIDQDRLSVPFTAG